MMGGGGYAFEGVTGPKGVAQAVAAAPLLLPCHRPPTCISLAALHMKARWMNAACSLHRRLTRSRCGATVPRSPSSQQVCTRTVQRHVCRDATKHTCAASASHADQHCFPSARAAFGAGTAAALAPQDAGWAPALWANGSLLAAAGGVGILGATTLIHIYITPIKRALQALAALGCAGGAWLALQHADVPLPQVGLRWAAVG